MNLIKITMDMLRHYFNINDIPDFFLRLEKGEVVEGEVIELLNNMKFLILVKGVNIIARSSLSLRCGDWVMLEVVKLWPEIVLSLIAKKNNRTGSIEVKV